MTFDPPLRATKHCRHYSYERCDNPLDNGPRCAAGRDLSVGNVLHCLPERDDPVPSPHLVPCALRQEYTDAERAAWRVFMDGRMNRTISAIAALPRPIPLRSGGNVPCPSCDGSIRYDRWHRGASLECSTPNCCSIRMSIAPGVDWPPPAEEPK